MTHFISDAASGRLELGVGQRSVLLLPLRHGEQPVTHQRGLRHLGTYSQGLTSRPMSRNRVIMASPVARSG
jgi:hypothetical protein